MQEQTKITILLISVIVVAVLSLIFIFYQYGKIQSQFTARMIEMFPIINPQSKEMQARTPALQDQRQLCIKPNCQYSGYYRAGQVIMQTGNIDVNNKNIQGCHTEKTELTLKLQNSNKCRIQKIICTAGGWTTNSQPTNC